MARDLAGQTTHVVEGLGHALLAGLAGDRNRLDAVVEALPSGLLVLDRQGRATFCNAAFRRLFGLAERTPVAGLTAAELLDLVTPCLADPRATGQLVGAFLPRGHEPREIVFELGGPVRRIVECSSTPVRERGRLVGRAILCRELLPSREAQRFHEEFLALVSHELRTPLASVKAYAQLAHLKLARLEERSPSPDPELERIRGQLRMVNAQADRLARMIDQLSDISRLRRGKLELHLQTVDLADVAARSVETFRETNQTNPVELTLDGRPAIRADVDRLDLALSSLLASAARYSPDGSPIEVRVSVVTRPGAAAQAEVCVADRGEGVPEEELSQLYGWFSAVDPDSHLSSRAGLGLYVVGEIVRLHGGQIVAERQPGQGSRFGIRLPLLESV